MKTSDLTASIEDLWIPVDREMPRPGAYVIVWVDRSWLGSAASSGHCCHYVNGKFELNRPGGKPSHWMSFPQQPPTPERGDA